MASPVLVCFYVVYGSIYPAISVCKGVDLTEPAVDIMFFISAALPLRLFMISCGLGFLFSRTFLVKLPINMRA